MNHNLSTELLSFGEKMSGSQLWQEKEESKQISKIHSISAWMHYLCMVSIRFL